MYRHYKSKREQKYYSDVNRFLEKTKKLLNVFQKKQKLRSEMEKDHLLKMTKANYQYYEDKKATRNCHCTLESVPSTSSDIRLQSRII